MRERRQGKFPRRLLLHGLRDFFKVASRPDVLCHYKRNIVDVATCYPKHNCHETRSWTSFIAEWLSNANQLYVFMLTQLDVDCRYIKFAGEIVPQDIDALDERFTKRNEWLWSDIIVGDQWYNCDIGMDLIVKESLEENKDSRICSIYEVRCKCSVWPVHAIENECEVWG